MRKDPYEATLEFINKKTKSETDRWDACLPNNYMDWEDFKDEFIAAIKQHKETSEANSKKFLKDLEEKEAKEQSKRDKGEY
ncbi:MAG: hypothetical protein WCR56_04340 [Bacilli bacterium]